MFKFGPFLTRFSVDQQTRVHDQTFKGSPTPPFPAG